MGSTAPDLKQPLSSAVGHGSTAGRLLVMSCVGAFLGLSLLKFGNPAIMEKWVSPPTDIFEFVLGNPWPIAWAYILLTGLVLLALRFSRSTPPTRLSIVLLPGAWLLWQLIATAGTIQPELSRAVLVHFLACVACFYLGLFCSKSERPLSSILPGLLCGFLIVLAVGWEQHFGGLEQTRRYFFLYLYPKMKEVSPEYLKKLSSPRIFSTLFYPNALAGAILLLLPATLQFVWLAQQRFTASARAFLLAAVSIAALGCLYWSGSKGGWLLMLLLLVLWLLHLPFNKNYKYGLIGGLLVLGLLGFFWKYSSFFQKGATSVSARFDYWSASVQSARAHPLLGTGPGTFSITYSKLKRPESEMARLAHNDYLQQLSDSGLPGFLLYCAFVISVLTVTYPRNTFRPAPTGKPTRHINGQWAEVAAILSTEASLWFAVWLGTLGWALQSLMEFGLYLPALAWPAFAFMGCLVTRRFTRDSAAPNRTSPG